MFFGNVIYQINNISSIGFVDLSDTVKIQMPFVNYALLFAGVIFMFIPQQTIGQLGLIAGIIMISIAAYRMIKHQSTRIDERYGMTIYSNSGTKKILTSKSKEFIFQVILTLSNVMNNEEFKAININFDTLDMSDQSITIGKNTGSPIVKGSVGHDLINNVDVK